MEPVDVYYDGKHYCLSDRGIDELERHICHLACNGGGWIDVEQEGDGVARPARLFIGPGTPIALLPS